MKLLREISRIIFIIGISFGIYKGDFYNQVIFSILFLFGMYIYPGLIIFVAKLFKAKPSNIGYRGELLVKVKEEGEEGQITFKINTPIEDLIDMDDISLLIKKISD